MSRNVLPVALLVSQLWAVPGRSGNPREAAAEPAGGSAFVIVQPGYPGSTRDAEAFVGSLAAYLAEKMSLTGLKGEYHNDSRAGLDAIALLKPAFGVVSVGFYLEHREKLGLEPLLESGPSDNFVLVVREGEVKDLKALKGQLVAGGPLHELPFLHRVVFASPVEPDSWDSKPVFSTSRALRDLVDRKKLAAVLLTGREYKAFAPLYQTKRLEKVAESDYYPPAFLVAFRPEPGSPLEASRNDTVVQGKKALEAQKASEYSVESLRVKAMEQVKGVFSDLSRDLKGKKLLETMGAEKFGEIQKDWLKELERKYADHEKK